MLSSTRSDQTADHLRKLSDVSQLNVSEWLTYFPIFVDLSELNSFASWAGTEIQDNVLKKALDKIKARKERAWISPDFTTRIDEVRTRRPGFDVKVSISFRLRTLCLEIRCWKSKTKMKITDAFEEMRKSEEDFRYLIEKWGRSTPVCNILVVDPFYDTSDTAREWLTDHAEELAIFPDSCHAKGSYTMSVSKLIEKDEKSPFLVTNIRDHSGIERRLVLICGKSERSDEPQSYFRARWVFFTVLLTHVLERATKSTSSIKKQMSKLEANVLEKIHEQMKSDDLEWSMGMLRSITDFCGVLFQLENELALASDEMTGVERNLSLIRVTADSQGVSKESVSDEKMSGNVKRISSPQSSVGHGEMRPEEESLSDKIKCDSGYCCALCENREGKPPLLKDPPLGMGVVGETTELIEMLTLAFSINKSEITRSLDRVTSFLSKILDVFSTRVNLGLNLSQSRASADQKAILSKMEGILEESEKNRTVAEDATKAVEILSLLFASFVLAEISSNFIIWGMQQIWPSGGVPWFAYVGGFLLVLTIACLAFLSTYLVYLKRKWKKRV